MRVRYRTITSPSEVIVGIGHKITNTLSGDVIANISGGNRWSVPVRNVSYEKIEDDIGDLSARRSNDRQFTESSKTLKADFVIRPPDYAVHSWPARPCHHQRDFIGFHPGRVLLGVTQSGFQRHEFTISGNGQALCEYISGLPPSLDYRQFFDSSNMYGEHTGVTEPDWVSLYDKYDEACTSFVPSQLIVGEDIVEYEIFKEAFLTVLNPTRAIRSFLRLAKLALPRRDRARSLGHVVRSLSRVGANSFLGYNFGIAPAISDIRKAIGSHRKVQSRMAFLRSHPDEFVPIRVREAQSLSAVQHDPTNAFCIVYARPVSIQQIATVGCVGRVRKDLNFGDSFTSYLQYFGVNKVFGLAWELIPFSFVVDWFTNAQEYINRYTRFRTGSPFTEYRNFCGSLRVQTTDELMVHPGYLPSLDTTIIGDPVQIALHCRVLYNRFLQLPNKSPLLSLSEIGFFQILAGASLTIQRLVKHSR